LVEDVMRRELPSEKRILVDEIYRVLYFNNRDPEKVFLVPSYFAVQY